MILGPAEQILRQTRLDESYTRKQVYLIKHTSQKLLQQANELLNISKLGHDPLPPEQHRGDLTDFIACITTRFREAARHKHIRLNLDSQLPVADYLFDRNKIDQILSNLLIQFIRRTLEGGKIHLKLATCENSEGAPGTRITIQGIPTGGQSNPLDGSTPIHRYEDLSIKQDITKKLVEFMNGSVEMVGDIDNGMKAILFLPLQPATQNILKKDPVPSLSFNDREEDHQPLTDRRSDRPVVQVIAGHAGLKAFLYDELSFNYQVLLAGDGDEGVLQAIEYLPDLIISEVAIQEKDGFDVCDILKRHPMTNHIPVVLLNDRLELKNRLKGFQKGADAYLTQPFSVEELVLRIQQLIATRKLLEEKYKGGVANSDKTLETPYEDPDQKLVNQLHAFIEKELDNERLNAEQLAQEAGMSHSQLYRKVKALTNLSIASFVREYRLRRAMELLCEGHYNVTEVAYHTGFSNRRYFHKVFVKKYGQAPSGIRKDTHRAVDTN